MSSEKVEEFTLEVDSELRFEIEAKNSKVTVEVSTRFYYNLSKYLTMLISTIIVYLFVVEIRIC